MKNDSDKSCSKVKLMHFIHGMSTGGAETLVKNYMLNFNKDKFEVVLLCLNRYPESPYEKVLADAGVKMVFIQDYVPFKKRKNVLQKTVNYPFRFFLVPWLIRQEDPDIIHTHLLLSKFLRFAKIKEGTKIFHTIHNEPKELYSKKDLERRLDLNIMKKIVKKHGVRFIVLHDKMKEEIDRLFNVSDSIVLNNGVDIDRIRSSKKGKDVRNELNISEDVFVVGHVGRFSSQKNHTFLVDVFKKIEEKNNKSLLLMIGNGPDKEQIIKKMDEIGLRKKYIVLTNRDDVFNLMNAMDVFVFPSLYEGLPLSLIEAQIAEKPCFISDRINRNSIISNLVETLPLDGNAEKWADKISAYKKPKKIVLHDKEWNIKNITKKLEQIYLDELNNGGKK